MEHSLFRYVWRHSRAEQLVILAIVVASWPFYYLSLDLPKAIVNRGIQGEGFGPDQPTQRFLAFDLPFGEWLTGAPVRLFDGFALQQESLLIALSLVFLALVVVNGYFKLTVNTRKGRLGERMLRRLRYELADRVLRFPLVHLRRMKQAEVATMIKDEVEPLGGFIGDAFVTPVFLGGQALTAMIFIMVQSVWLGLVAVSIVLLQAWIIPRLRRRILQLGKQRQLTARQLAGRVAEVIDGAVEIHANDTSNWERADLVSRLGRIFHIRFEIYQRKFFVKFLNNFMSQLTPFIFYLMGGLLALKGLLDIGALVAVIAAYKDLPGPIKELIDWDQQRLDVQIKYGQVVEQFEPGEVLAPEVQAVLAEPVGSLAGQFSVANVTLIEEDGSKRLDGVSFELPLEGHLAVLGDSASGKERLALLMAGLERPTGGSISIGGRELTRLPQSVTGRRLAYVGLDAYLFPLSVRDNLLYGLRHAPLRAIEADATEQSRREHELLETQRSGNPVLPVEHDWIDRGPLGGDGPERELTALLGVLRLVDMEDDVYRLGLGGFLNGQRDAGAQEGLLEARLQLRQRLDAQDEGDLVARFDPAAYNRHATLAENLLFGTPTDASFRGTGLAGNAAVLAILRESDLFEDLLQKGLTIAKTMLELFADLPPGHPFFEQFSFIDADDLAEFKLLTQRADKQGPATLPAEDRQRLLRLTFGYVEARHRLGLVDEALEQKVLVARGRLAEKIADGTLPGIEPYHPERYNPAASILDNVLFGRLVYGQAEAEVVVGHLVGEILEELGLKQHVLAVGLDYNVGNAGKRLSAAQRQKLALGRALIKDADVLIVNDALAVLDAGAQARLVEAVRHARQGKGLIWYLSAAAPARRFDRILVLDRGRKVADGPSTELDQPDSPLARLAAAG